MTIINKNSTADAFVMVDVFVMNIDDLEVFVRRIYSAGGASMMAEGILKAVPPIPEFVIKRAYSNDESNRFSGIMASLTQSLDSIVSGKTYHFANRVGKALGFPNFGSRLALVSAAVRTPIDPDKLQLLAEGTDFPLTYDHSSHKFIISPGEIDVTSEEYVAKVVFSALREIAGAEIFSSQDVAVSDFYDNLCYDLYCMLIGRKREAIDILPIENSEGAFRGKFESWVNNTIKKYSRSLKEGIDLSDENVEIEESIENRFKDKWHSLSERIESAENHIPYLVIVEGNNSAYYSSILAIFKDFFDLADSKVFLYEPSFIYDPNERLYSELLSQWDSSDIGKDALHSNVMKGLESSIKEIMVNEEAASDIEKRGLIGSIAFVSNRSELQKSWSKALVLPVSEIYKRYILPEEEKIRSIGGSCHSLTLQ